MNTKGIVEEMWEKADLKHFCCCGHADKDFVLKVAERTRKETLKEVLETLETNIFSKYSKGAKPLRDFEELKKKWHKKKVKE